MARVTDLVATLEPVGGGAALATQPAAGGALYEADFRALLAWPSPPVGAARVQLTVRYRWAFDRPGAGEAVTPGGRIEVRVDVDGRERRRAVHARPEPAGATRPAGDGEAPAGPSLAPQPALRRSAEAPDPDTVRGLERGGVRLGLAVAPAALGASAMDAPGQPSGYGLRYLTEAATLAVARDLGPGLSAGVAVQAYAGALGDLRLPVSMPDGFGGTQAGALEIERAVAAGLGGSVGLLWDLGTTTTVGLHYQSRAIMSSHHGTATVRGLTISSGTVGATTGEWDVRVRDFGLPQRAGAALAWRPLRDALLLVADVTWWDWSDRMNDLKLVMEDPDTPGFLATGARIHRVRVSLNWEDRFTVAAGATWRALPVLCLHAGYAWGRNPYAAGTVHPLLPAIIRHHVAAGLTVKLGRLSADAGVVWGLRDEARLVAPGLDGARLRVWSLTVQAGFVVGF
jgi:hypothetical protein